jgi:hypothetical protein
MERDILSRSRSLLEFRNEISIAGTTCRSPRACSNRDLARRYCLCRDRSGLALSGHGPGPLPSKDCWLDNVRSRARRPAVGSFVDGHIGPRLGAGLIHHSDRRYARRSISAGFQGSPLEPQESFFHTLKTELVHHRGKSTSNLPLCTTKIRIWAYLGKWALFVQFAVH